MIQYRATVFQPRSQDVAETTVLVPAGGADHSDEFKVATASGVAGFQPYLDDVSGRFGRINDKTKNTDKGSLTMIVGDPQLAGSGFTRDNRWVTEFMGTNTGTTQLMRGNKVLVERSQDDGATWSDYFTGRVRNIELDQVTGVRFELSDMSPDAEVRIYSTRPSATLSGVSLPRVLPLGPESAYAGIQPSGRLTGTIDTFDGKRRVTLDVQSILNVNNIVTTALGAPHGAAFGVLGAPFPPNAQTDVRMRFTSTSPAITDKETDIISLVADVHLLAGDTFVYRVGFFDVKELDSDDLYFTALDTGTVPNGTAVTFELIAHANPGETVTKKAPLLIDSRDPIQHLRDVLDGLYGYLDPATGDALRKTAYLTSSLTALIGDPQIPPMRWQIDKPVKNALKWLSENILRPLNLSYYFNASGQFVLVDTRLPTSLTGLTTITSADLWGDTDPQWKQGTDSAFRRFIAVIFREEYITDDQLQAGGGRGSPVVPNIPATRLKSFDIPIAVDDFGDNDIGDKELRIEIEGFRFVDGEVDPLGGTRDDRYTTEAIAVADLYRAGYTWGPMFTTLRGPSDGNLGIVTPAEWLLIDVDELPDPATNDRGGQRVMRVLEVSDTQGDMTVRLIDGGPNVQAAPPVIGALTAGADAFHWINIPLTLNGNSDHIELQKNVTAQSVGTRPADSDPGWRAAHGGPIVTSQTILNEFNPSGSRIWFRARSVTSSVNGFKLPSAWVYPSGADFLDTTTIAAPSSLAVSNIAASGADLSWTNGNTKYFVQILLSSPSGDTPVFTGFRVLPGDTKHRVVGTVDSDTYGAQVRHSDQFGGFSALSNKVTWTATGADPTAPDIRAFWAFNTIQ